MIRSSILVLATMLGLVAHASIVHAQKESTADQSRQSVVEGFSVAHVRVPTPSETWEEDYKPADWFEKFTGTIEMKKGLGYRKVELAPGKYDVWLEKGKADWFHLFIGNREDAEAPRIRALFRAYPLEDGVDELRLELKLVSRGRKLKFTVLSGPFEGHGNLRVVDPDAKEDGD